MQLNRFAIGLACVVSAAFGQGTDWPTYGGDLASSKYRPLDQINAGNFSQLEIACVDLVERAVLAAGQVAAVCRPVGALTEGG